MLNAECEARIIEVEDGYELRLFGPKFPRFGALVIKLRVKPDGSVDLNWLIAGPQPWPEALPLIEGLLNLTVLADRHHHLWETRVNGKKTEDK